MNKMDHQVPTMEVPNVNQVRDSAMSRTTEMETRNNNFDSNLSDKLTPLFNSIDFESDSPECQNQSLAQSSDVLNSEGFCRQQSFSQRDMELSLDDNEENESREQMEIQIREEAGDYGDIQFFHHKLMLQQHLGHNEFGIGSEISSFGAPNGHVNAGLDPFHIEECDDNGNGNNFSENPFLGMEFGEPQFFPGNPNYLETILEETDEEFEEEEGCSGRYWWTANSDTDTDSVIDQTRYSQLCNNNNQSTVGERNLKSEDLSLQSTFRSSASSKPFEAEDLHLLDQLDLAFEQTLMEPRRRSGFAAFGNQLHLLDQPLKKQSKFDDDIQRSLQRSFSNEDFIVAEAIVTGDSGNNGGISSFLGNNEESNKAPFGSSSSESPNEIAEDVFFHSEEESSSDDSEKNDAGVILAEFSLFAQTGNGGLGSSNSFNSGGTRNRRSLLDTASSRLKSFRSFDSLNSLTGTELLFSKADTFPSFHYIKEDVETNDVQDSNFTGGGGKEATGGGEESQSLPSHTVSGFPPTFNKITKKTSSSSSSSTSTASSSCNSATGMMSSENLSEDSGIGQEGAVSHPRGHESFADEVDQQDGESARDYISKSEFALNPLLFSSLSSSSDAGSNSPSINSVPSLTTNESPSADSYSDSELKENQRSVTTGELRGNRESSQDDSRTINHNSLSNFHQGKVDESDSSQIETTPPPQFHHQGNHKAEPVAIISSSIPFEPKLPISISINDPSSKPSSPALALTHSSTNNKAYCSTTTTTTSQECGLHPYSDAEISATRTDKADGANKAPVISLSLSHTNPHDRLPDNLLNTSLNPTLQVSPAKNDIPTNANVHSNSDPVLQISTIISSPIATATSINPQESSVSAAKRVGVHCQVPISSKEMGIGERLQAKDSVPPPPLHCQEQTENQSSVVMANPTPDDEDVKGISASPKNETHRHHKSTTRERSNSESEFECVESAVELDYAIVNSDMVSSSPKEFNGATNVMNDEHVNKLNGESRPMSTLTRSGDGMQKHEQKTVDVMNIASQPAPQPSSRVAGHANGSSVGNNSIGPSTWSAAGVIMESGIKSAKISLHHHHHHTENESGIVEQSRVYLPHVKPTLASPPQKEAVLVGQDHHHNGVKPSRSVNADNSSSADVVHQLRPQHSYEIALDQGSSKCVLNKSECGVDRDNNKVSFGGEEDTLVIATSIDPVHIGVAEVKKFTQLDSSIISRKSHHHQVSAEKEESESEEQNIGCGTGQASSNFGFLGTFSHTTGSSRFTRPSQGTKSSTASSASTTTESSELPVCISSSPQSFTCYPIISGTQLHSHSSEGDNGTEIPEEANKRNRDRGYKSLPLLGVYSATVLGVAHAIPSKSLSFENERNSGIVVVGVGNLEESQKGITERRTNPHATTTTTATTGFRNKSGFCPPDILVKQTHSPGRSGDGDREVIHTGFTSSMEVDTNTPVGGDRDRRSASPSGVPIKTRTYGNQNQVEVVLVSSRTPSPASTPGASFPFNSSLKTGREDGNNSPQGDATDKFPDPPVKVPRTRVHFSPVVSEISWRESYIDQELSGSAEDIDDKSGGFNNSAEFFGSNFGASSMGPTGADSSGGGGVNGDSLVRPLQLSESQERDSSNQSTDRVRQQSPPVHRPEKGPILVEKVQMRSSFLQGGEEDEDELDHGNLSMNVHISSPVDEGHYLDNLHKETVHFRSGSGNSKFEHDFYEDVNVNIQPVNNSQSATTLSVVPDLLSQCENACKAQTHINVCIEPVGSQNNFKPPLKPKPVRKSHSPTPPQVIKSSEIPPPPMTMGGVELHEQAQQQQIFPKMFAEDVNGSGTFGKLGSSKSDSKNNSSSSLNKGKKSKSFGLSSGSKKSSGETTTKERDNKEGSDKDKETDASKENKMKATKPGFFERLSKIRLSGSKPKKQKVHPKMDELEHGKGVQPLKTHNTVNLNGNSSNGNSSSKPRLPAHPILKNSNNPTPVIPNYTPSDYDAEPEPNEANQAFENILEEIAGIKSIKMRIDKSSSQNATPERPISTPPQKEMRTFAKRKQFYSSATDSYSPSPPMSPNSSSVSDLDKKLSQFKEETSKTRVAISKSHPDLELIEDMVRQQSISPGEPLKEKSGEVKQNKSPESKKSPKKSPMSETGQKNDREWFKLLKSAAEKYYYRGNNKDKEDKHVSLPCLETNLDSEIDLDTTDGASREMLDHELVQLDKKASYYAVSTSEIPSATSSAPITTMATSPPGSSKARSLTNLSTRLPLSIAPSKYDDVDHLAQGDLNDFDERAKSYEFLLDDNQKSFSVPPENKLRTETRQLSEHELRIQRSLQRLNVPEWFKNHEATSRTSTPDRPSSGQDVDKSKILTRRTEYGSAGGLAGGWAGLSAFKAPSMSSLQNSTGGRYSGSLNRSNFIRGRPATMSATRLSRESLTGTGSASHSPSAYDRCSFTYGMPFTMTRFGQGRMSNNSGTVTPTSTADSTASTTNSSYVKKPYLGWRSQERLNALAGKSASDGAPKLSVYLPPEERLAAELIRSKVIIRPPVSDRPPLPKPPPRSDKTALSKTPVVPTPDTMHDIMNANSIPPPRFSSDNSQQVHKSHPEKTPDIHDSIREVTRAINQYVEHGERGTPPKPQARKKSPARKAIWMESSFVGRKPASK